MSDAGPGLAAATPLDAEDLARANLYGLVSRLFYGPADPNLLAEIIRSGQEGEGEAKGGALVAAWSTLRTACAGAYPAIVRQEYDTLFVGVGKSEVTPYLSAYAEPSAPDLYLVRLRDRLTALGLGRRESVFEVEDHISGVSDVMRWLIEDRNPLEDQQRFFESFVYPGAVLFCVAVQNASSASFYKQVATFAQSFFELERTAFEMSG
ncbi:MAG: molecular chaperone TorD family protein [Betaproteobacteria bacterium]|nr:molecular chaperone TorD family protein [Betaproteobacteria bacterium]